jgi:hypothetical protein
VTFRSETSFRPTSSQLTLTDCRREALLAWTGSSCGDDGRAIPHLRAVSQSIGAVRYSRPYQVSKSSSAFWNRS